jgi:hypothetical protein
VALRSRDIRILTGLCLLLAILPPAAARAQSVTQLQVLLPGETAAPGTATGKLGVPQAQTVGEPFQVLVRACDNDWYTVAGVSDLVAFSSSDASASLPGNTAFTAGEMTVTVTFNAAGSFTVSADDLSDPTIPTAASAFVDALLLSGFEFSAINQKHQYAGQSMNITLSAVDPGGGVVTGYSGQVQLQELTSYGIGRVEPSEVTLSNGQWSGSVACYRADETNISNGNVNLYAFLGAHPEKNGTSDPFVVHPGELARVQIVVPGQEAQPGGVTGLTGSPATQSAAEDFVVDLFSTDEYWNPLSSSHNLRITSSDPAASTPVNATLSNGHAQATLSLGTVGDQTLTVTDMSDGSVQGMTTAFIPVIPSSVHHFVIEPLPPSVVAGETVTVTIRAADAGGNTMPDYYGDAVLSANTGAGSITPEMVSFTAGLWTGDMVFRGAGGAVSFSCSDFSSPPHVGTSDNFQVLPGDYVALQVVMPGQSPRGGTLAGIEGVPDDQNAGTPFDVLLRAVDQYYNRVPTIANHLGLASSDPNVDAPADIVLAGGEVSVPVTMFLAGEQTLTVADLDSAGITDGVSDAVTVLPGAYARILLLAPGQTVSPGSENGYAGEASPQSISFAFTMTVHATDDWWNPVGVATDVIGLTSSDIMAELPPPTAMVDGSAELVVRLATGGYQQFTAANQTQPAMPTSETQVLAISSGVHLEASVTPEQVQAGEPFTLTVRAVNDAGAVIQEINSFVEVTVANATTQQPGEGELLTTTFQLLQGQRSVQETYTCAEPIVLTVADDEGNAPAITNTLTVVPGAPATVELVSDPTWLRGNRTARLTATVADAYGNGVPQQAIAFVLERGGGVLTPLDEATGEDGTAAAEYLSPWDPGVAHVVASAAGLSDGLDIETALVDPNAKGGMVTNYPNPFHPDEAPTIIAYVLDTEANVRLRLFTLSGAPVLDESFAAGDTGGTAGLNEYLWQGLNGSGEPVASGGYVLVIDANSNGSTLHTMRRKIALVR